MVAKQRGKAIQQEVRSRNVKRRLHIEDKIDDENAQKQKQKSKKTRVKVATESKDSGSGSDSGSESTSHDWVLSDYTNNET